MLWPEVVGEMAQYVGSEGGQTDSETEAQQAPTKRYPVPKSNSQSQSKGREFMRYIEPQQARTKRYPKSAANHKVKGES